MTEILLSSQPIQSDQASDFCSIDGQIFDGRSCTLARQLSSYVPYVVGKPSGFDQTVTSMLSVPSVARELTNISLSFGEDNTIALAEITKKLHEYNIGLVGASTSVYARRLSGFAGAIIEYQDALLDYREAIKANSSSKAAAKQKAFRAFEKLQIQFQHELKAVNAGIKSNRGTPLTSATRATNIARSSRNTVKLNVTSQAQAHNLVKFTKHANYLGNGLALIDFTSRAASIRNEYKAGGNWERELFIESSSFALSASAGIAAVNIGTAALTFVVAATPVGWVGLVVGGVIVAGTAAATSMGVNSAVKDNAGSWYDFIMSLLGV